MTKSKKNLIDKLMALYPYSVEWFMAQPEKKLWAMYYSHKPKEEKTTNSTPQFIVESGTTYVLTDAGNYEEVYD